jgi:hypothetical protein
MTHKKDDRKWDVVVANILNNHSECKFKQIPGDNSPCAPEHVIDDLKVKVLKTNEKISHRDVINRSKKMFNCKSEICVLRKAASKLDIENMERFFDTYFKPRGPSLSFDLLSNVHIDNVLEKLSEQFVERKFLHIPYQMRDFEKVGTELADIDLAEKINEGYKTFGVVLNTDYSSGGGIHWFCLFGEEYDNNIQLEYFNSSGNEPLPEVQAYLQKTRHWLEAKLKKECNIYYTTNINFQKDRHSCGVYCCAYIWFRLAGIPAQWFKVSNFEDSLMHKLRYHLFRSYH